MTKPLIFLAIASLGLAACNTAQPPSPPAATAQEAPVAGVPASSQDPKRFCYDHGIPFSKGAKLNGQTCNLARDDSGLFEWRDSRLVF